MFNFVSADTASRKWPTRLKMADFTGADTTFMLDIMNEEQIERDSKFLAGKPLSVSFDLTSKLMFKKNPVLNMNFR